MTTTSAQTQTPPTSAPVTAALSQVLAESAVLSQATLNFHWNVTGPHFPALHTLFMNQYTELNTSIDDIAERLRALRAKAPASFAEFLKLSTWAEPKASDAMDMVAKLLDGNEHICKAIQACADAADKAKDDATNDLMIVRLEVHQKNAWMLRSILG